LSSPRAANAGDVTQRTGAGARESVQTACLLEQAVGERKRIALARSAPEHERHELVVAEGSDAEPFEFLAWSIVWRNSFHVHSDLYASPAGVAACHASCSSRLR
jgi:hypothetical protein